MARRMLTNSDQRTVDDLLATGVDWTNLVTLAEEHRVTSLLCFQLINDKSGLVPKALVEAAKIRLERAREHNKEMAEELLDLLDRLSSEKIPAVPFKGPVLAQQAYGDLGLRSFVDLDFLIHASSFPKVRDILKERGHVIERSFTPAQEAAFIRYAGEDVFPHAGDRPPVEPHWEFAPGTLCVSIDYPALWSRKSETTLLGHSIPCWDTEDTVLILCIHGSKSLWIHLSWICDIAELIRRTPDFSWTTLLKRSQDQGCLRMVGIGLLLARDLLNLDIPESVIAQLQQDKAAQKLANELQQKLMSGGAKKRSIYRLSWFHFNMRERLRDRLRYVFRTITNPRVQHFRLVRLPDTLFFGYYPIKLTHDYCLLPIWKLVKRLNLVGGTLKLPDGR